MSLKPHLQTVFDQFLAVVRPLDEIGGVSTPAEYIEVMQAIQDECISRVRNAMYAGGLTRCQCSDPGCREHPEDYECSHPATHALINTKDGTTNIETCEACGRNAMDVLEGLKLEAL